MVLLRSHVWLVHVCAAAQIENENATRIVQSKMFEFIVFVSIIYILTNIIYYVSNTNLTSYCAIPEYTINQLSSLQPGTLVKIRGAIAKLHDIDQGPLYEHHTIYRNYTLVASYENKTNMALVAGGAKLGLYNIPFRNDFNYVNSSTYNSGLENSLKLSKKHNFKIKTELVMHWHDIASVAENTPIYVIGTLTPGNILTTSSNSNCGIYSSSIEADTELKTNRMKTYEFARKCVGYATLFTAALWIFF